MRDAPADPPMALVVGLYETFERACHAAHDLVVSGFPHDAVTIVAGAESRGLVSESAATEFATTPTAIDAAQGVRVDEALFAAGLNRSAAAYFDEAIRDGGVLVAVRCEEGAIRDARDILDAHTMDEVEEQATASGVVRAGKPVQGSPGLNGRRRH